MLQGQFSQNFPWWDWGRELPLLQPSSVLTVNCVPLLKSFRKFENLRIFSTQFYSYEMTEVKSLTDSTDMNLIVKDREAWHATVHKVAKSQTRISD